MREKHMRKVIKLSAIVVTLAAIILGGIYLWGYLSTGTSLIARGIMWRESDAGDLHRFPTRQFMASSNPVFFEPAAEDLLSKLPVTERAIEAVDMPLEDFLEVTNATAFIVLHGDQLLFEAYFNGSSREAIQGSFSAAKSFVSTLVGIAIDEGYIESLDDPITVYLPELLDLDPRYAEITVRHLITMSSGLRWDRSDSNPFSDDFRTYYSPNLRETALSSEIIEAPGQRFLYND
jgi:CubicO group peptidase (beta-lactamase class C family)